MTPQQIKADKEALDDLKKSRGWALLSAAIQQDVLNAAYALGENPRMPMDEIHFRRGAIFAAKNLPSALDTLILSRENELLLISAQAENPPNATA